MKQSNTRYRTSVYNNLDVIHFKDFEMSSIKNIICQSEKNTLEVFEQFLIDPTVSKYNYGTPGKKEYRHRIGYKLTILLPLRMNAVERKTFAEDFMVRLLDNYKLPWICEEEARGLGTYLNYYVLISRKYHVPKETVIYRESYGYRSSKTGRICKDTDENAVMIYKPGDVYSTRISEWSHKVRFFEMSSEEFEVFKKHIEALFSLVVKEINQNFSIEKKAFTYKKHKTLGDIKSYKNINFNQNIKYYNSILILMNDRIRWLETMLFSPAKFAQDSLILRAYQEILHKYKARIKNETFSYKKRLKLSINPLIRGDVYKENLFLLYETFENDVEQFINTYISIVN